MLQTLFGISVSMALIIACFLLISPFLNKSYTARWRYFVWLMITLRLLLPFNFGGFQTPVTISEPTMNVMYIRADQAAPMMVMENGRPVRNFTYEPVTLVQALTLLWLVGAAVFLAYNLLVYLLFIRKIKRRSRRVECAVAGAVPVFICKDITSPMLIGLTKPRILLPDADYSDNERDFVIKHELAHMHRRDIAYKLLLLLANAVHWFNPLVYAMVYAANKDIEMCCDDVVINDMTLEMRKLYSGTILNCVANQRVTRLSTNFNGGKDAIKQRFANILHRGEKRRGLLAMTAAVILIVSGGSLVACSNQGQNPFSYGNLQSLMGQDKPAVLKALRLSEKTAKVEKQDDVEQYSGEVTINGTSQNVSVVFNKDVLVGYQYIYKDTQQAYNLAKEIRSKLEQEYGKPTTGPITTLNQDRFDNITGFDYIATGEIPKIYYEDFTIKNNSSLEEKLLGDTPLQQLEIRLGLSRISGNNSIVFVRYMMAAKK